MCVHANLPQTIKSPNHHSLLKTGRISMIVVPFDSPLTVLSNPRHLSTSSDRGGKKISYSSTFFDRTTSDKETSSSKRQIKV
jgi:hypothetical protein